jgi:hypothetical protein
MMPTLYAPAVTLSTSGYPNVQTNLASYAFPIPSGTYVEADFGSSGTVAGLPNQSNCQFYAYAGASAPSQPLAFLSTVNASNTHSNGTFNESPWGSELQSNLLTLVNAAAGSALEVWYDAEEDLALFSDWSVTNYVLSLILTPTSTGGTPTQFAVTETTPCSGGCVGFTVQLLDSGGNAANAGGSGQTFSFAPAGNIALQSGTVMVASAGNSATFTICSAESGTFSFTLTPGSGALSGLAAQTITATFCGAPTDPNNIRCSLLRPNVRDAVRRNLGIEPPIDSGVGNAGDEPMGQRYPTNSALNQFIGDAIRLINQECRLHVTIDIPIAVAGQSSSFTGPLTIPLNGYGGACSNQNAINSIRRVRFVDSGGNITPLRPTHYWELDKNRWSFDTVTPSNPPRWYIVDGYKLLILPAPAASGTLYVYAGTAIPNFAGDSDLLDEIPNDLERVIEVIATAFACRAKPDEPNNAAQYQMYMQDGMAGLAAIRRWFANMNEAYQPGLSAATGRRRRVR